MRRTNMVTAYDLLAIWAFQITNFTCYIPKYYNYLSIL
jgi:hypothetical protein